MKGLEQVHLSFEEKSRRSSAENLKQAWSYLLHSFVEEVKDSRIQYLVSTLSTRQQPVCGSLGSNDWSFAIAFGLVIVSFPSCRQRYCKLGYGHYIDIATITSRNVVVMMLQWSLMVIPLMSPIITTTRVEVWTGTTLIFRLMLLPFVMITTMMEMMTTMMVVTKLGAVAVILEENAQESGHFKDNDESNNGDSSNANSTEAAAVGVAVKRHKRDDDDGSNTDNHNDKTDDDDDASDEVGSRDGDL